MPPFKADFERITMVMTLMSIRERLLSPRRTTTCEVTFSKKPEVIAEAVRRLDVLRR